MGIICSNCKEEDKDLDLIETTKEEIEFPKYYSNGDLIFESLNENNLLQNITLIEYINLLSNINNQNSNVPFEGPYKMNFSDKSNNSFLDSNVSEELFEEFITKRLLSHRNIGNKESIFKNICIEVYKNLKNKLKDHYNDNNFQITKKNLIGLGLFFCIGRTSYQMKLIFDLFKNER